MRVVEELRTTVDGHERRQRAVDGLHEEIDRLSLQIAGLSLDRISERRIEAIEERINSCERTKVAEKQAVDIAHTCVAGSRVAQDEFDKETSEGLKRVIKDVEMLAGLPRRCTPSRELGNLRLEGESSSCPTTCRHREHTRLAGWGNLPR